MNCKKLLIPLLIVALAVATAEAAYWNDYCVNSTTMNSKLYLTDNTTGAVIANYDNLIDCSPYECNSVTGRCNTMPETNTYYHAIGIMCLIIAVYLAYAIINTRPKESEGL